MTDSSEGGALPEIKIELVRGFGAVRRHCHVCGGMTEKETILCEGKDEAGHTVRVCETCLAEGNIDARIVAHAERLERIAADTRQLIGRLKVPAYSEWLAARDAHDAEVRAEYEELNQ